MELRKPKLKNLQRKNQNNSMLLRLKFEPKIKLNKPFLINDQKGFIQNTLANYINILQLTKSAQAMVSILRQNPKLILYQNNLRY